MIHLGERDFVTSDTHINDKSVARRRYCGDDVEKMNRTLAEKWDYAVGVDSTVLVLGDVIIGDVQAGFDWFRARPGKKILVAGNWDEVHWMHEPSSDTLQKWLTINGGPFEMVMPMKARVSLMGTEFEACHYPYGRSEKWSVVDEGRPLLHGHTHSSKKISTSSAGSLQVHAGWDAWRKLAPVPALLELARSGS